MTKWQRIKEIIWGAAMMFVGALLLTQGSDALPAVMGILAFSLSLIGLRMLIYYFTMARHMVDGGQILIWGLILFDLGSFSAGLTSHRGLYVMGYLLAVHAFSGFIDVLRALEAKRLASPSWRLIMSVGIINIAIALACVVFIRSTDFAVYIYSAGVIYAGIVRIVLSFRRTAVAYIEP